MPEKDPSNPQAHLTLRPNGGIIKEGYKTRTRSWRVRDEETGELSNNTQTEHTSGRIDAHVRPPPVRGLGGVQRGTGAANAAAELVKPSPKERDPDAIRREINGLPNGR